MVDLKNDLGLAILIIVCVILVVIRPFELRQLIEMM